MNLEVLASILWRATWQGSLALVAVWLICALAAKFRPQFIPASVRYWLWWLACLQFLVRLVIVTPVELRLLPSPTPATVHAQQSVKAVANQPQTNSSHEILLSDSNDSADLASDQETPVQALVQSAPNQTQTSSSHFSWSLFLLALWGAGVGIGAIRLALRYRETRKLLKAAVPAQDPRLGPILNALNPGKKKPSLQFLESPTAPCPLLAGWWQPKIVFPAGSLLAMADEELEMAIAHELVHLRRHDLWLAIVPVAAQLFFFFNPLLKTAQREAIAACEEACDIQAIALSSRSPGAYARFLIKSAQSVSFSEGWGTAVGTAFNTQLLQRRITMITSNKNLQTRHRRGWSILLPILALGATPWTVTAQVNPTAPAPVQSQAQATVPASPAQSETAPATPAVPAAPAGVTAASQPSAPAAQTRIARAYATSRGTFTTAHATSSAMARQPIAKYHKIDKKSLKALHKVISVHFKHTPLEAALTQIFAAAKVDFVINGNLGHDTVTGSLTNASLSKVLSNVLKPSSKGLTWSAEDGVFRIYASVPRPSVSFIAPPTYSMTQAASSSRDMGPVQATTAPASGFGGFDSPTIAASSGSGGGGMTNTSPGFGGGIGGGGMTSATPAFGGGTSSGGLGGGSTTRVSTTTPARRVWPADPLIRRIEDFSVKGADIRESLKILFKSVEASFTIDPAVVGNVTASFNDVSLRDALSTMLKLVHATYRVEGGVVQVIPVAKP